MLYSKIGLINYSSVNKIAGEKVKQWGFNNIDQIKELRARILKDANDSVNALFSKDSGIELLRKIKFEQSGYDSLLDKKTNFIEQVNQTFTYLVCLAATEKLIGLYPDKSFNINFGVAPGYDVVSEDGSIICECFAVTTPDSNRKLELDTKKVFDNAEALKRYVIFYASVSRPKYVENIQKKYQDIEIIQLETI